MMSAEYLVNRVSHVAKSSFKQGSAHACDDASGHASKNRWGAPPHGRSLAVGLVGFHNMSLDMNCIYSSFFPLMV